MSDQTTPETKWYVTEYPVEGSFAITDGYEIFAQIIGGKTVGDECDLASRIAKLPDLERERDEARNDLEFRRELYKVQEQYLEMARRERDDARAERDILKLDAQREAEHHDRMVKELEGLYDKNAKLRDIAERALNFGEYRAPYLAYPGPTWEKLRAELDQLKEGAI